jgi:hypothetical protein
VRARSALARLPAEYRAIDQAPQITARDLAALIGIRLGAAAADRPRRRGAHHRRPQPLGGDLDHGGARAGVMEPFANHAFQPRGVVRRIDLAQAVARLLPGCGADPARAGLGLGAAAVQRSVAEPPRVSGRVGGGRRRRLSTRPGNAFQPSKPVTGAEAIDAISKLEALSGQR